MRYGKEMVTSTYVKGGAIGLVYHTLGCEDHRWKSPGLYKQKYGWMIQKGKNRIKIIIK